MMFPCNTYIAPEENKIFTIEDEKAFAKLRGFSFVSLKSAQAWTDRDCFEDLVGLTELQTQIGLLFLDSGNDRCVA